MSTSTAAFGQLNSTGHAVRLSVPLSDGGSSLGDIAILINSDDTVLIPKQPLVELLQAVMTDGALSKLRALPTSRGRLSLAELAATGIDIKFDRSRLELTLLLRTDQRVVIDAAAEHRGPVQGPAPAAPASISGYVNIIGGLDYYWGDDALSPGPGAHVDLQSAIRIRNFVFENDASIGGRGGGNLCPLGAACLYNQLDGARRSRSRLTYDLPEDDIRIEAGDADVFGTGFQRGPDVAGITIEKAPHTFAPSASTQPSAQTTFRIDRPSEIEVRINGAVVRQLRLAAGVYALSDLPLPSGASDIDLLITDGTGQQRTLHFTTFAGENLLATGKSEWSVSVGVPSYLFDGERRYDDNGYFASGFLRYGVGNAVTGEANLQADQNVVMGGSGATVATAWGLFGLDVAASNSDTGFGFATELKYDLSNFRGPISYYTGLPESLRWDAEYRSTAFRVPGEFLVSSTDTLYPQFPYWLRLSGYYTMSMPSGTTATLGARYQFANDKAFLLSPLTFDGDRYGLDLTLSRPLNNWASGSLLLGYSNESYAYSELDGNDDPAFRVMVRLSIVPAEDTRVEASYDTLNNIGYLYASHESGQGVGSWQTAINAQQDGSSDTSALDASVTYIGNRAEVRASQRAGLTASIFNGLQGSPTGEVTSLEVGTALAFADGTFAVGRPIRSNGFAIVTPHESLAGKTIIAGTTGDIRAEADAFGPGLVSDLPAYSRSAMPVDVADLPMGYSLGPGLYDTVAPYRAGYRFEVGSANSVSVYGTLLDARGGPVSLLTGVARAADQSKQVDIFTNSAGRFAADGLAPGRWIIEMDSENPTKYSIDIPTGTIGLFKAGVLLPSGAG